jgi:orotidine 5'-phosphate decarboxylase subfamily 1
MSKEKLILAIDKNNWNEAFELCREVKENVGLFKLGLEFFLSFGSEGVNKIAELGVPIFLDLKLHDIPNTVSKAATALISKINGVSIFTLHASGGKKMLETTNNSLKEACLNLQKTKPQIFGITVLTSTQGEQDSWEGSVVLFPFAMVVMRALNTIKKLKEKNDEKLQFAYQKLITMVKSCNDSLGYWSNLYEAEELRITVANKALLEDENVKHLNLELKSNVGKPSFYSQNQGFGIINDVVHFASNASESGIEGIVCSALEISLVKTFFPNLKIITPGIRPLWYSKKDDQSRVATPSEAIKLGADYFVIGRPITESSDPKKALIQTLEELGERQ